MRLDISREWDLKVFLETPKCKNNWRDDKGMCLLSSFWKAWGYNVPFTNPELPVCKLPLSLQNLLIFTNSVAQDIAVPVEFDGIQQDFSIGSLSTGFTLAITSMYDNGREAEAINLLWQLIEKLPNKKNWISEMTPTPAACGVR